MNKQKEIDQLRNKLRKMVCTAEHCDMCDNDKKCEEYSERVFELTK